MGVLVLRREPPVKDHQHRPRHVEGAEEGNYQCGDQQGSIVVVKVASSISSLLQNPAKTGTPPNESAPMVKVTAVMGITRPQPPHVPYVSLVCPMHHAASPKE